MAAQTTVTVSPVNQYLNKNLLAVAQVNMVYGQLGEKATIPKGNSKTFTQARFDKFASIVGNQAASMRTINEGITPTDGAWTRTTVSVALSQYGFVTSWTDQVDWIEEWQVDTPLADRNSEDMAETMDKVTRDAIAGGSTVYRLTDGLGGVSGAARVNVAGRLNAKAFDKIYATLRRNGAYFYKDKVEASTKVGTVGVRSTFACISSTDAENDLVDINQFSTYEKYGGDRLAGEFGVYGSIRVVTTTLARIFEDAGAASTGGKSKTGTNADVYLSFVFGKMAYTSVDLEGTSQVYYIPPSQVDKSDRLGQTASLGWKAMGAAVINNDAWFGRVEHIVSSF